MKWSALEIRGSDFLLSPFQNKHGQLLLARGEGSAGSRSFPCRFRKAAKPTRVESTCDDIQPIAAVDFAQRSCKAAGQSVRLACLQASGLQSSLTFESHRPIAWRLLLGNEKRMLDSRRIEATHRRCASLGLPQILAAAGVHQHDIALAGHFADQQVVFSNCLGDSDVAGNHKVNLTELRGRCQHEEKFHEK